MIVFSTRTGTTAGILYTCVNPNIFRLSSCDCYKIVIINCHPYEYLNSHWHILLLPPVITREVGHWVFKLDMN